MRFFARCAGVFIICWIILYFVVFANWTGEAAGSASLLLGGVISIVVAVLYGMFDELWIQHRQF